MASKVRKKNNSSIFFRYNLEKVVSKRAKLTRYISVSGSKRLTLLTKVTNIINALTDQYLRTLIQIIIDLDNLRVREKFACDTTRGTFEYSSLCDVLPVAFLYINTQLRYSTRLMASCATLRR